MGAQARQAARTQPAAARRHRHELRRPQTARRPPSRTDVRYVITLDADTRLPRDAARRLIGKMAHPLNRPRFEPERGSGSSTATRILQPRVTPSLPVGREGSLYQRVFSGPGGIDPYAAAVSDVYQDLFGEGSYTGKGIYDVDAFEAALDGRVPDNALLSHDLFEGIFARAGLASDIEVVEEFPARYDVAAKRQHRWARGDWQLLPWIMAARGPAQTAGRRSADRALEDARQSAALAAGAGDIPGARRLAGCCCRCGAALVWTAFVLPTIAVPAFLPVAVRDRAAPRRASRCAATSRALGRRSAAGGLADLLLSRLPRRPGVADGRRDRPDAGRLFVTPPASARMGHGGPGDGQPAPRARAASIGRWPAASLSALACRRSRSRPSRRRHGRWRCLSCCSGWRAPAIALVDQPVAARRRAQLGVSDRRGPDLAPDRAPHLALLRDLRHAGGQHAAAGQLPGRSPSRCVAHRTSPTNIGLYLLSAVAARDFGWAGTAGDGRAPGSDAGDDG